MATLDKHAEAPNWASVSRKPTRLGLRAEKHIDDPCDDQESLHPLHGDQMEAGLGSSDPHKETDPSPADSAHNGHTYYRAPDEAVPTLE